MQVLTVFLSLVFCLNTTLLAEPSLGRLPDGRAYRVADDGVEMVDHLAELELTVEELKTRMHGLEYELEEKNNIIKALKNNGAKEAEFKEVDLLVGNTTPSDITTRPVAANEPKAVEELQALTNSLQEQYQEQLEQLQDSLVKEQEKSAETNNAFSNLKRDFELLQDQRNQLQAELASQTHVSAVANNCPDTKEHELGALESRYQELDRQHVVALQTINDLQTKIDLQTNELLTAKAVRPLTIEKGELSADVKAAYIPNITTLASDDTITELKSMLNRIRGMNIERERRYSLYRMGIDNNRSMFKLSNLRTKSGSTLNSLSSRSEQLLSKDDVARLKAEINELKNIIENDIAKLGRLAD